MKLTGFQWHYFPIRIREEKMFYEKEIFFIGIYYGVWFSSLQSKKITSQLEVFPLSSFFSFSILCPFQMNEMKRNFLPLLISPLFKIIWNRMRKRITNNFTILWLALCDNRKQRTKKIIFLKETILLCTLNFAATAHKS